YTIPDSLTDGTWFWRVAAIDEAGNQSLWSANSRVFVDAVDTPVPTLYSPADTLLTSDAVLTFDWSDEVGVKRYNLQVNSSPNFDGVMRINVNPLVSEFRNAVLPLGSGTWYWQVRALGTDNIWGEFSAYRTITVDRVKPARPNLASPPNNTTTADNTPLFTWDEVGDADVVGYIIQIDKNYFFASPEKIEQQVVDPAYTPGTALVDRRWFWRVAAVDAAGNVGPWSAFWSVIVDTSAPTSDVDTSTGNWWEKLTPEQRLELWKRRNGR
ncbi:MAG: hypothetical protein JXA10_10320, partial [Anaerolineae bacterium]|nr:hypothetical protein [Anaerolineae bacterium]